MSMVTVPASRQVAWRPVRDAFVVGTAVALALLTLYAVFLDQGALLAPLLGSISFDANYVHEFAHDARHLSGVTCH
ncbi:MAG: CbtB domain-containing protein [Micromonosporaceae bacterium]